MLGLATFCLSGEAKTRVRGEVSSDESVLSYDLGASAGNYGGASYSEINLGLNWQFSDWLVWRNAVFNRMSSGDSSSGLDTSLRFQVKSFSESGTYGFQAFAGPGYRFASKSLSAAFVEAGLTGKLGGLTLGIGAKTMMYNNPGQSASGADLPKSDTSYFLILGGGGVL